MKTKTFLRFAALAITLAAVLCAATFAAVPDTDVKATGKVISVVQGGVIAEIQVWQLGRYQKNAQFSAASRIGGGPSAPPLHAGFFGYEDEPVFIAGLPSAVDGDKIAETGLRVAGRYNYTAANGAAKTIRAFSMVPVANVPAVTVPAATPAPLPPLGSAMDAKPKHR